MKDEELPEIFGNENEKHLSLEEIMEADAKDSAAEDETLNKERKKGRGKKIILLAGGGVLALSITAGMVFMNPFGGNTDFDGDESKSKQSQEETIKDEIPAIDSDLLVSDAEAFAYDEKNMYPIELEDWLKTPHGFTTPEEIKSALVASYAESELFSTSNTLPSEASGYTADANNELLEDGTLNPMYSYWTAESFQVETAEYIERLLNPVFGGWDLYQYSAYPASHAFDVTTIEDMFTNNWRSANIDKPYAEYIPVFADWGGNDYGMGDVLLTSGTRWFGQVTNSNTNFVYNDEIQQYNVTMTANVKFTAWAKDQSKLEKTGTLTLNLVPNIDNENESGRKVLIENASLKVDG